MTLLRMASFLRVVTFMVFFGSTMFLTNMMVHGEKREGDTELLNDVAHESSLV